MADKNLLVIPDTELLRGISNDRLSLCAAHEAFYSQLWCGRSPLTELGDERIYQSTHPFTAERCRQSLAEFANHMPASFARAFYNEALEAIVEKDTGGDELAIPAQWWSIDFHPERVFLTEKIPAQLGACWNELAGRTPFVRRSHFESWLEAQCLRRGDAEAPATSAVQSLKEALMSLVMNGVVRSSVAEGWAQDWGLPPFEYRPTKEKYDPIKLPHWTLCMAASWIVWRTLDAVRVAMDDYRANWWVWVEKYRRLPTDSVGGFYDTHVEELETVGPTGLSAMGWLEAQDINPGADLVTMSIRSARKELWLKLAEGKLSATGFDAEGQLRTIPAHEWSYLQLAGDENGIDYLVFLKDTTRRAYTEVTIPRSKVTDTWQGLAQRPRALEARSFNIEFAIDPASETVLFANGPRLSGNAYKLIARLSEQYDQDLSARKASSGYSFIRTERLARDLDVDDERLRKWIERARRDIGKQFEECCGVVLDLHDVVETDNWNGYRLNPMVRLVSLTEVDRT